MSELKEKVLAYVMETPENTNIAVLASIIDANEVQPAPIVDKITPTTVSFKSNYSQSITTVNLAVLDWSKLTSAEEMFYGNYFTSLDLSGADTSNILNMSKMFKDSISITSFDVSTFDTSKVKNMYQMFMSCGNLTEIKGLQDFVDTAIETDSSTHEYNTAYMFYGCKKLKEIRIPEFTKPLGDMCFYGCTAAEIIDISGVEELIIGVNNQIFGGLEEQFRVPATCQIYVNNQDVKDAIVEQFTWFGTGENIHVGAPTE